MLLPGNGAVSVDKMNVFIYGSTKWTFLFIGRQNESRRNERRRNERAPFGLGSIFWVWVGFKKGKKAKSNSMKNIELTFYLEEINDTVIFSILHLLFY